VAGAQDQLVESRKLAEERLAGMQEAKGEAAEVIAAKGACALVIRLVGCSEKGVAWAVRVHGGALVLTGWSCC
jgi:hypothetical protein